MHANYNAVFVLEHDASLKYLLIFFFYNTQEDRSFSVDCSDDIHNHLVPKMKSRIKINIVN